MAKSRFEYVRNFELPDPLLPETFIVVRIDGRGFHKFSDAHNFDKPNDVPALDLMNRAARAVLDDLSDVVMAFGESDEYSFLIRKQANLYNRRRSKINSTVCSIFTSAYVFYWNTFLPDRPLQYPPTFDSRVVLYPSAKQVRDYFSWRQADTHINNLYNTSFWALVKSGMTTNETNKALQGTDSKDKNELLFSRFGINYNKLPEIFRKGSILVRQERRASTAGSDSPKATANASSSSKVASGSTAAVPVGRIEENLADLGIDAGAVDADSRLASRAVERSADEQGDEAAQAATPSAEGAPVIKMRQRKEKKQRPYEGSTGDVVILHVDIIGNTFWDARPWLLA